MKRNNDAQQKGFATALDATGYLKKLSKAMVHKLIADGTVPACLALAGLSGFRGVGSRLRLAADGAVSAFLGDQSGASILRSQR